MSASKKEADSPPVDKSQQESSHRTFSEFLDCVRQFSVEERLAALTEPGDWMALPLGPTRELDTADGKELLKYVWDHLPEFKAKEREAIQAYFVEHLKDEDNHGIIIANAVRSCMLEHSEELESDDVRVGELKQETQDSQPEVLATTDQSTEQGSEKITANGAKELDPADEANTDPEIPEPLPHEPAEELEWWEDEKAYIAGHTKKDTAENILVMNRKTLDKLIKKGQIKLNPLGRIPISEIKRVIAEEKRNEDIQA